MSDVEVEVNIDSLEEFAKRVKPTPKSLEQKYRDSVDSWIRCLNSNKNNKYGERLERAVNRRNRLKLELNNL